MLDDLRAFILADSTVLSLVSARMYPHKLPQSPTVPAISYEVISEVRGHTMGGRDKLPATRVQIDAWATTYAQASQLGDAILFRLDAYRGLLNGSPSTEVSGVFADTQRTMFDSEPELHRVSRDFFLFHREA